MRSPMDEAIQAVTPVVAAPKFGELSELGSNAQRYIVASDGLYLEVRRPWLHVVHQVALIQGAASTPYGQVSPQIDVLCGPPPAEMLAQFMRECAAASPNEHAAWITWSEKTGSFRYRSISGAASPAHITFQRPELEDAEWCVLDMHSHGEARARFSSVDDRDDAGEVKQALVLGNVVSEPRFVGRLCVLGNFISFNPWADGAGKDPE